MDELNLYDDLDEFQEQQDKKSKELQEVEEKYQCSLKTIEDLEANNRTLQKKIKRIELSFQSLLDTARAEIKRKDKEIERLRKEKDDICFRRKIPPQHTKELQIQHIAGEPPPPTTHQQQFVKNPFRSEQKETIVTVSQHANITEQVSTVIKETNYKEHSQSTKRYHSHDEDRDGNCHKKYKNHATDEKYHETPKFLKSDRDARNKEQYSARQGRVYKEAASKSDFSRNHLGRDDSRDNKNLDKQYSKSSNSPERLSKRLERKRSRSREIKKDHNNKGLETDRSCERKKSYKSSKSPERNSKRLERERSRERITTDRHHAKDYNRSKSSDRKYSDKNLNKSSKSLERKDHKHYKDAGPRHLHHHDDLLKYKSERNQHLIENNKKDENPLTTTDDEQHLSQGKEKTNEITCQKTEEEKKVNCNKSKNDQDIKHYEKKEESVKIKNAKEKIIDDPETNEKKLQEIFHTKQYPASTDKQFDASHNASKISSRDASTCSNKVDALDADTYNTDLMESDFINQSQVNENNLNEKLLVKQNSTIAQILCTPDKLALYNSLFGPSPSNCSSTTTSATTNSGTSFKSLLANIQDITAKAKANNADIEVVSLATTSPGVSTDMETSFKDSDPNGIDDCFTKNYDDKEIKNNISSIDLTKDEDAGDHDGDGGDINKLEFIQIPGLDLPTKYCGKNDKTTEESFNDKLKNLFENKSKSEAVTKIVLEEEIEEDICVINKDILPQFSEETTIFEFSKMYNCDDKNSSIAKSSNTSKTLETEVDADTEIPTFERPIDNLNTSAEIEITNNSVLGLNLKTIEFKELLEKNEITKTAVPLSIKNHKTFINSKDESQKTIQQKSKAENCIPSEISINSTKSSELCKNKILNVNSIQKQEFVNNVQNKTAAKKTEPQEVFTSIQKQNCFIDSKNENSMQEYQKSSVTDSKNENSIQEYQKLSGKISNFLQSSESATCMEVAGVSALGELIKNSLSECHTTKKIAAKNTENQEVFITTKKQEFLKDSQAGKSKQQFIKAAESQEIAKIESLTANEIIGKSKENSTEQEETEDLRAQKKVLEIQTIENTAAADNFVVTENTSNSTKTTKLAASIEMSEMSTTQYDLTLIQTQKSNNISLSEIEAKITKNHKASITAEKQETLKDCKDEIPNQTFHEVNAGKFIATNSTSSCKLSEKQIDKEIHHKSIKEMEQQIIENKIIETKTLLENSSASDLGEGNFIKDFIAINDRKMNLKNIKPSQPKDSIQDVIDKSDAMTIKEMKQQIFKNKTVKKESNKTITDIVNDNVKTVLNIEEKLNKSFNIEQQMFEMHGAEEVTDAKTMQALETASSIDLTEKDSVINILNKNNKFETLKMLPKPAVLTQETSEEKDIEDQKVKNQSKNTNESLTTSEKSITIDVFTNSNDLKKSNTSFDIEQQMLKIHEAEDHITTAEDHITAAEDHIITEAQPMEKTNCVSQDITIALENSNKLTNVNCENLNLPASSTQESIKDIENKEKLIEDHTLDKNDCETSITTDKILFKDCDVTKDVATTLNDLENKSINLNNSTYLEAEKQENDTQISDPRQESIADVKNENILIEIDTTSNKDSSIQTESDLIEKESIKVTDFLIQNVQLISSNNLENSDKTSNKDSPIQTESDLIDKESIKETDFLIQNVQIISKNLENSDKTSNKDSPIQTKSDVKEKEKIKETDFINQDVQIISNNLENSDKTSNKDSPIQTESDVIEKEKIKETDFINQDIKIISNNLENSDKSLYSTTTKESTQDKKNTEQIIDIPSIDIRTPEKIFSCENTDSYDLSAKKLSKKKDLVNKTIKAEHTGLSLIQETSKDSKSINNVTDCVRNFKTVDQILENSSNNINSPTFKQNSNDFLSKEARNNSKETQKIGLHLTANDFTRSNDFDDQNSAELNTANKNTISKVIQMPKTDLASIMKKELSKYFDSLKETDDSIRADESKTHENRLRTEAISNIESDREESPSKNHITDLDLAPVTFKDSNLKIINESVYQNSMITEISRTHHKTTSSMSELKLNIESHDYKISDNLKEVSKDSETVKETFKSITNFEDIDNNSLMSGTPNSTNDKISSTSNLNSNLKYKMPAISNKEHISETSENCETRNDTTNTERSDNSSLNGKETKVNEVKEFTSNEDTNPLQIQENKSNLGPHSITNTLLECQNNFEIKTKEFFKHKDSQFLKDAAKLMQDPDVLNTSLNKLESDANEFSKSKNSLKDSQIDLEINELKINPLKLNQNFSKSCKTELKTAEELPLKESSASEEHTLNKFESATNKTSDQIERRPSSQETKNLLKEPVTNQEIINDDFKQNENQSELHINISRCDQNSANSCTKNIPAAQEELPQQDSKRENEPMESNLNISLEVKENLQKVQNVEKISNQILVETSRDKIPTHNEDTKNNKSVKTIEICNENFKNCKNLKGPGEHIENPKLIESCKSNTQTLGNCLDISLPGSEINKMPLNNQNINVRLCKDVKEEMSKNKHNLQNPNFQEYFHKQNEQKETSKQIPLEILQVVGTSNNEGINTSTSLINLNDIEKEQISPQKCSTIIIDSYNKPSQLPSIATNSPTPSNFSGLFSKKSLENIAKDDDLTKSKKKSPHLTTTKLREYILPAASVLCNIDNLENANKKLHWELLDNKNEMTEIEDDTDVDNTDEEKIKITEGCKEEEPQPNLTPYKCTESLSSISDTLSDEEEEKTKCEQKFLNQQGKTVDTVPIKYAVSYYKQLEELELKEKREAKKLKKKKAHTTTKISKIEEISQEVKKRGRSKKIIWEECKIKTDLKGSINSEIGSEHQKDQEIPDEIHDIEKLQHCENKQSKKEEHQMNGDQQGENEQPRHTENVSQVRENISDNASIHKINKRSKNLDDHEIYQEFLLNCSKPQKINKEKHNEGEKQQLENQEQQQREDNVELFEKQKVNSPLKNQTQLKEIEKEDQLQKTKEHKRREDNGLHFENQREKEMQLIENQQQLIMKKEQLHTEEQEKSQLDNENQQQKIIERHQGVEKQRDQEKQQLDHEEQLPKAKEELKKIQDNMQLDNEVQLTQQQELVLNAKEVQNSEIKDVCKTNKQFLDDHRNQEFLLKSTNFDKEKPINVANVHDESSSSEIECSQENPTRNKKPISNWATTPSNSENVERNDVLKNTVEQNTPIETRIEDPNIEKPHNTSIVSQIEHSNDGNNSSPAENSEPECNKYLRDDEHPSTSKNSKIPETGLNHNESNCREEELPLTSHTLKVVETQGSKMNITEDSVKELLVNKNEKQCLKEKDTKNLPIVSPTKKSKTLIKSSIKIEETNVKKINSPVTIGNNKKKIISLEEIGIKVRPFMGHLSTFRIPKINKDLNATKDKYWKLETCTEICKENKQQNEGIRIENSKDYDKEKEERLKEKSKERAKDKLICIKKTQQQEGELNEIKEEKKLLHYKEQNYYSKKENYKKCESTHDIEENVSKIIKDNNKKYRFDYKNTHYPQYSKNHKQVRNSQDKRENEDLNIHRKSIKIPATTNKSSLDILTDTKEFEIIKPTTSFSGIKSHGKSSSQKRKMFSANLYNEKESTDFTYSDVAKSSNEKNNDNGKIEENLRVNKKFKENNKITDSFNQQQIIPKTISSVKKSINLQQRTFLDTNNDDGSDENLPEINENSNKNPYILIENENKCPKTNVTKVKNPENTTFVKNPDIITKSSLKSRRKSIHLQRRILDSSSEDDCKREMPTTSQAGITSSLQSIKGRRKSINLHRRIVDSSSDEESITEDTKTSLKDDGEKDNHVSKSVSSKNIVFEFSKTVKTNESDKEANYQINPIQSLKMDQNSFNYLNKNEHELSLTTDNKEKDSTNVPAKPIISLRMRKRLMYREKSRSNTLMDESGNNNKEQAEIFDKNQLKVTNPSPVKSLILRRKSTFQEIPNADVEQEERKNHNSRHLEIQSSTDINQQNDVNSYSEANKTQQKVVEHTSPNSVRTLRERRKSVYQEREQEVLEQKNIKDKHQLNVIISNERNTSDSPPLKIRKKSMDFAPQNITNQQEEDTKPSSITSLRMSRKSMYQEREQQEELQQEQNTKPPPSEILQKIKETEKEKLIHTDKQLFELHNHRENLSLDSNQCIETEPPSHIKTVIQTEEKSPLTATKPRRRRVVKVISISQEESISDTQVSYTSPSSLTSPNLNHPIFHTEVTQHYMDTASILPPTPNKQYDDKFKEIDSKLNEIFQSPQYIIDDKTIQPSDISTSLIPATLNNSPANITIEETIVCHQGNDQSSLNTTQFSDLTTSLNDYSSSSVAQNDVKHISLGSSDYRFEKVNDNVVNLFITRKRKRKRTN